MSSFESLPILVFPDDLEQMPDDVKYRHNFDVDEVQGLLDSKFEEGVNGAVLAAGLLLTRAAVSVVHIDISETRASFVPGDARRFYEDGATVGFNDHFGGSESSFKILLNGSPSGKQASHVLLSPPDESGRPTNTTFRNCDFTFPTWESDYMYTRRVPNPLKTSSVAGYRGSSQYEYFLFGGPDAPAQVYEQFADAGFDFVDSPYSGDLDGQGPEHLWFLRRYEDKAYKTLGYRGGHYWPGDQFSEQLIRLGLETPKLSATDYPLVRPENQQQ